jgi:hypothetical protein
MTKIVGGRTPPGNEAARRSHGKEARPKRFNGNSNRGWQAPHGTRSTHAQEHEPDAAHAL